MTRGPHPTPSDHCPAPVEAPWTAVLGRDRQLLLHRLHRAMRRAGGAARALILFETPASGQGSWTISARVVMVDTQGSDRVLSPPELCAALSEALDAHPLHDGLADGATLTLLGRGEATLIVLAQNGKDSLHFPVGPRQACWQDAIPIPSLGPTDPNGAAALATLCLNRLVPGETVFLNDQPSQSAHEQLDRAILLRGVEERFGLLLSLAGQYGIFPFLRAVRTSTGCVLLDDHQGCLALACAASRLDLDVSAHEALDSLFDATS